MKMMKVTNQIVTKGFFKATLEIIAESTSSNYSSLAIDGLKKRLSKEFKFLKYIHIDGNLIKVDKKINFVTGNELKKFFIRVINITSPDYLKMLLSQKLDPKELIYLEDLGLKFG